MSTPDVRRPRLAAAAIEQPLLALALIGATAVAIVPIWAARFLPLLDEPNHLSAIFIWHALSDPGSSIHEFYEPNVVPVSYLLHYGLAYWFAKLVSVEAAHKLVLSLYVASWPAAAYLFCRRTGRTPWLALTTLPLAYSTCWAHGYHPYNLGVVACLFGVSAHDRLLAEQSSGSQTRSRTASAWLLAATASLACYFGHPVPLAVLSVCAVVLWIAHGARLRGALASASAFIPAYLALAWQARAAALVERRAGSVLPKDFPVLRPERWLARVEDFSEYALNALAGPGDSRLLLGLLALTLALYAAAVWTERTRAPATRASRALDWRALWLALVLLALYLVGPEHLNEPIYMWILRGRLAPIIAFFVFLSPPLRPDSRLRITPLAAVIAVGLLSLWMTQRYREFDRSMQGLVETLPSCPAEDQVLTVRLAEDYPGFDVPVFRELASWVQVLHGGGYNPATFPRPIPFPFAVKRHLPAPHWRAHHLFARVLDPRTFGCVVFLGRGERPGPRGYRLGAEHGPFELWLRPSEAAGAAASAGGTTRAVEPTP